MPKAFREQCLRTALDGMVDECTMADDGGGLGAEVAISGLGAGVIMSGLSDKG